ncbi:chaplin [Streptomyces sp. NBC_01190]|uniref:chaplin n=1 Tax=Streptomyces sp. NBC_01190 TaxID=2903767 RepID=UPI0038699064|nr:chaplin [Streptomyces sp. NBC_01190]
MASAPARGAHPSIVGASGTAIGSPGVLSGNALQVPIDPPVDARGNSLNLLGVLSPALGTATCANVGSWDGASDDNSATADSRVVVGLIG